MEMVFKPHSDAINMINTDIRNFNIGINIFQKNLKSGCFPLNLLIFNVVNNEIRKFEIRITFTGFSQVVVASTRNRIRKQLCSKVETDNRMTHVNHGMMCWISDYNTARKKSICRVAPLTSLHDASIDG